MMRDHFVLDLFCGCGGFSLGFKLASDKFKTIGAIDFDKAATQSYDYNLRTNPSELIIPCDIKELPPQLMKSKILDNNLQLPDIIIGGPPCPGFSTMGRSKISSLIREGVWMQSEDRHAFIDDPRNILFYEFVKYVKYFQPKIFIFENVKGISSSKKMVNGKSKAVLDIIETEFQSVNYITKRILINSADFGVPQARERYFIVGINEKYKETNFKFPEPTHFNPQNEAGSLDKYFFEKTEFLKNSSKLNYVTSMQALLDLPVVNFPDEDPKPYRYSIKKAEKEFLKKYSSDEYFKSLKSLPQQELFLKYIRTALKANQGADIGVTSHAPRWVNKLGDREIFPLLITERNKTVQYADLPENLRRFKPNPGFKDRMRRIPWWKPSWTIVAHLKNDGYMFIHPDREQNRTITVREAARLQSFPDNFDCSAGGELARGHQFRHIGNAVPPLVSKALAQSVIKWLNRNDE